MPCFRKSAMSVRCGATCPTSASEHGHKHSLIPRYIFFQTCPHWKPRLGLLWNAGITSACSANAGAHACSASVPRAAVRAPTLYHRRPCVLRHCTTGARACSVTVLRAPVRAPTLYRMRQCVLRYCIAGANACPATVPRTRTPRYCTMYAHA